MVNIAVFSYLFVVSGNHEIFINELAKSKCSGGKVVTVENVFYFPKLYFTESVIC